MLGAAGWGVNRYQQARAALPRQLRRRVMREIAAAWRSLEVVRCDLPGSTPRARRVVIPPTSISRLPLVLLLTRDYLGDPRGLEEHVSLSHGPGAELPSWDALVLVRALAWPDTAEVHQLLPPLEGPGAEPWVNIDGVEVLHLRHTVRGWSP